MSDFEHVLREAALRVTRPRPAVLSAVHDPPRADTNSIVGVVRDDLGEVSHQAVYDVLRGRSQLSGQMSRVCRGRVGGHPTHPARHQKETATQE
jgi:hypothetical protein